MGLFNSLFEKKSCDICGKEIGLLGSRKLVDGVICKDCANKLSPYFTERKESTVGDIKEQLDYRAENKEKLSQFTPDYVVDGSGKQVRVDQNMGCFIVFDGEDWASYNPDLIPLEDVLSVSVSVDEHEEEIRDRDAQGHMVPREPREFVYDYAFNVTINLNHPYINTIRYEMTNYAHRPTSPYEDLFEYNVEEAEALYKVLTGETFSVNYNKFRYHEPEVKPEPIIIEKVVAPQPRPHIEPRVEPRMAPAPGMQSHPAPGPNGQPQAQPQTQLHVQPQTQNGRKLNTVASMRKPANENPATSTRATGPNNNRGPQGGPQGGPEHH